MGQFDQTDSAPYKLGPQLCWRHREPADVYPAPSRRRLTMWWGLFVALVVAAGIWVGLSRPWETKPLQVVTETAKAGPAERILAINGRIAPEMRVDISLTVGGRLESVVAKEGDLVKTGNLLATLDDSQQRAAVSQTQAALDGAMATLQQAKINLERAKGLGDAISRKDFDSAQLAVQMAQNDVDRLSAAKGQAMSLLAQYSIKAPFDGTVLVRGADPGQVVSASTVLFSIADLTHLGAEANVDDLYSAEIRRGLKARMKPSGYDRTLEGEVSSMSPTVDSSTGGRLVRVAVADTGGSCAADRAYRQPQHRGGAGRLGDHRAPQRHSRCRHRTRRVCVRRRQGGAAADRVHRLAFLTVDRPQRPRRWRADHH